MQCIALRTTLIVTPSIADAQQFAGQCSYLLNTYGIDGIDIDDEYSGGTPAPNSDSLAMVSYYVRQDIGQASFSKALYDDTQYPDDYFEPQYQGSSLGKNLTWGWTMTYGVPPAAQLSPYQGLMPNNQLACGFQAGYGQPAQSDIQWMRENGYAGVMVYNMTDPANQALLNQLLTWWSQP